MVQGKITEADTPTIWLGTAPSGLISSPPLSSRHFYARCPSCCNPATLSWLAYPVTDCNMNAETEILYMCGFVKWLHQAHVDDVHVICGCLKDFLRTLKEPLVTRALWKSFVEASGQHSYCYLKLH